MSHNSGVRKHVPLLVATAGWLLVGLTLSLYSIVIAGVTILLGIALWYLDADIGGFAVTQIGIAVVAPAAPLPVALLELGPALLLFAVLWTQGMSHRTLATMGVAGLLLGTMTVVGDRYGGSLLLGSTLLVLTAAISSYGLYRHELVRLGLVDGENA